VEEVQAVGGGRVSGAAGELPPPDGFFRFLGEVEQAAEVQGPSMPVRSSTRRAKWTGAQSLSRSVRDRDLR
jgi:hypothetical protein